MTDPVRVRVLGRVRLGDPTADTVVGRGQARELLALLVAVRHRSASTDAIIDALWDDDPPATAPTIVHGLVRRLRRALGDEAIRHDGDGYRLDLAAEAVDLWSVDDDMRAGAHQHARERWDEPVFGGYASRAWAREARDALDHLQVLSSDGTRPSRIPRPTGRLVGRRRELAALHAALERHRLVTVVGLGGVGKSRLAHEAAAGSGEVFLADLGGGVGSIIGRIADDIGLVSSGDDRWDRRTVATAIGRRDLLLVLDGCEHDLSGTADAIASLLTACPGLRVLATSRSALGLPGEHVVALLPFADPTDPYGDAVALLIERASALGITFGSADRVRLAAHCGPTAGVPLAIELVVDEAIFAVGDDGSGVTVATNPAEAVERVVDQALTRLTPGTASTIRRLAWLDHGFSPPFLASLTDPGISAPGILHELHATGLATSSAGQRLGLLDPVRDLLATRPDDGSLADVADALAGLLGAVRPVPARPIVLAALDPAVEESANVMGVLDALEVEDPARALRLVTAVGDVWAEAGHWTRGVHTFRSVLGGVHPEGGNDAPAEQADGSSPVDRLSWARAVRAMVTTAATYAGVRQFTPELSLAVCIAEDADEQSLEAHLRFQLTLGAGYDGDLVTAGRHLARLRVLAEQLDNDHARAMADHVDGLASFVSGDPLQAARRLEQVAARLEAMIASSDAARSLRTAGLAWQAAGELDAAHRSFKMAEALALESRSHGTLATIRSDLVALRHQTGNLDRGLVVDALESVVSVGNLRAAGLLGLRLGTIDHDAGRLANATLDLLESDPVWAAAALAALVEVLPRRHRLRGTAPEAAARLVSHWGSPLGVAEARVVERLCARVDVTDLEWSDAFGSALRDELSAIATNRGPDRPRSDRSGRPTGSPPQPV